MNLLAIEITTENASKIMGQYFWALIPALVAIILALITKEVYVSLFSGILVGALTYIFKNAIYNPIEAFGHIFNTMAEAMGPSFDETGTVTGAGNAGILIFIVELGILVALMNKAGGAQAFGNWVHRHVKSRKGALLATTGLGCILFIDDYFNRLAAGSIMQPINDKYRISRAKTTFIVGSLSVTICILVPISSWASAVASNIKDGNSFGTYVETIYQNFYPILLIAFLIVTSALGIDMFGLFKHEAHAIKTGDVTGGLEVSGTDEKIDFCDKGRVLDLVLPICVLVVSCCCLLLIKRSDGSELFATETALPISGSIALIFCLALYLPRKLMKLKEFTGCFATGFKSVADVIIIVIFAWTLKGISDSLNLNAFVEAFAVILGDATSILPALFFVVAMGIAFAIGTSWGTFGIMIPVVVAMGLPHDIMVLTISAVLSGAVFGDGVSPISDATILSAGACKSNHMGYIKAQMPNCLIIAAITFIAFLVSGFVGVWLGWIIAIVLFTALIITLYFIQKKNGRLTDKMYKDAMAAAQPEPADQPTAE
ncbi:MAG: Na+/H+ antiporter NhaC family protein [Clostridiales bacterium]|nr:Na+/H+ antiporter NhaC family protein [Clostridiales bacterium]